MEIETERLLLRPFKENDFDDVYAIYKDQKVCKLLLHEPWDKNNAKDQFQKKRKNSELKKDSTLNLAVVHSHTVIGDISVWYTEMKETVEIGYSFHAEVKGKGFATEAMKNVVHHLFKYMNIHRIQANLDARNVSSAKLCERIGMRKEAHFIQDFWNKEKWTDSLVYGLLASDWIE